MADVKISQLPAATTPVDGTEVLPIVQSATTKQVSIANLTAGRAMSASSLTLTTPLAVTSGGTGISTTGAGTFVVSATANTISATATPTLGVQQTTQGTLTLANTAAGAWPVTLQSSNSATAAWTMTLPTAPAAANGYILTSTTTGVTSWTNPTALGVDLDVGTTAITNGTVGYALFQGSGNVLQQSANFFWDNTNARLGIGTATPQFRIDSVQNVNALTPSLRQTIQFYARGYAGSSSYYAGIGFAMYEHTDGYWGSGILSTDDTGNFGSALSFYTSTGSASPTPTERARFPSTGGFQINSSGGGSMLFSPASTASAFTYTLPASTGTVLLSTTANNQSTTGPTITQYTSGSGTYTVPSGVKWIKVRMIGGGGGSGTGGSGTGGGGGAGGYLEGIINNPSATYTYAVGAGGGGTLNGGNTTFGSALYTANGGSAGSSGTISALGGAGGTASGGNTNVPGAYGTYGWSGGGYYVGGDGAPSPFGGGAPGGGTNNGSAAAAIVYGTGGGAGVGGGGSGSGASGVIIIEEHYTY